MLLHLPQNLVKKWGFGKALPAELGVRVGREALLLHLPKSAGLCPGGLGGANQKGGLVPPPEPLWGGKARVRGALLPTPLCVGLRGQETIDLP